jgi:hypothetical protein
LFTCNGLLGEFRDPTLLGRKQPENMCMRCPNISKFGGVLAVEDGNFRFVCVYAKDVPHAFRGEGEDPARLLQLTTPSGSEQGCIEMGVPATALTLPPPFFPRPRN